MNKYTLIGGGRLANHFAEYFRLRGISFNRWQRSVAKLSSPHSLQQALADTSHVLLLITDAEIESFVQTHPGLDNKTLIHCSGALSIPGLAGVHPLMTFADELYDLALYESIPMVCEASDSPAFGFRQLFPDLNNPTYRMEPNNKALYHAYCVAAGNFSQMLWQITSAGMQTELGLPAEVLQPYLQQNLLNFFRLGEAALTGPVVRGDQATIDANLQALDALAPDRQALAAIYRQFSQSFEIENQVNKSQERAA